MKIYTETGDAGETGLYGGPCVPKDHVRIEAYGDVDELSCVLGWCRTQALEADCETILQRVQGELFALGAELACPDPQAKGVRIIGASHVEQLEREIDAGNAQLAPLTAFILPGGSPAAAALHMARAVCRRAERRVTALLRTPGIDGSPELLRYLNRLSDLLFVLARQANQAADVAEVTPRLPES